MATNNFANSNIAQATALPSVLANSAPNKDTRCHLDSLDGNVKITFIVMLVVIGLLVIALLWSCWSTRNKIKKMKKNARLIVNNWH
jgi:Ca2+/Na+ antiporter